MKRLIFSLLGVVIAGALYAASGLNPLPFTLPQTFQTNIPANVAVMVLTNPVAASTAGSGTARNLVIIENNSLNVSNLVLYGHDSGVRTNGVALWGTGGSVARVGYTDNSQWWLYSSNGAPVAVETGTLTQ